MTSATLIHIRARAMATLVAAVLAACACPVKPDRPYVIMESAGGLRHIPAAQLQRSERRPLFRLDSLVESVAHGRSGCPYYDGGGTLLGGIDSYAGPGGRVFTINPAASIRAGLARARAVLGEPNDYGEPASYPFLAPTAGRTVVLLRAWGDINLGLTGAITLVDESWVALFAHGVGQVRGPLHGALAYVRPVALCFNDVGAPETMMSLGSADEPVRPFGAGVWSGSDTCVGIAGRLPRSTRFTVRADGLAGGQLEFFVVRRWSDGRGAAFEALSVALRDLEFVTGSGEHAVIATARIDDHESRAVLSELPPNAGGATRRLATWLLREIDRRASATGGADAGPRNVAVHVRTSAQ